MPVPPTETLSPNPQHEILDIAPLLGPDNAARKALDRTIGEALERDGLFVCRGLPGFDGLDRRARRLLAFFDRPEAERLALATKSLRADSDRLYRGYSASLGSGDWAHNEMLDFGPERPSARPALPGISILAEPNLWPDPEPTPGWRADLVAVFAALEAAGRAVLGAIARHFALDESAIERDFRDNNSTLRLLNYPPRPADSPVIDEAPAPRDAEGKDKPALVAGRHTDAAALSLLWQGQAGLQTETRDGRWISVPLVADGISVHLGDLMDSMTGGRLTGTPHRVLDGGGVRRSLGFFLEPSLAAPIVPLAVKDDAERGGSYGAYLLDRFAGYKGNAPLVAERIAAERRA